MILIHCANFLNSIAKNLRGLKNLNDLWRLLNFNYKMIEFYVPSFIFLNLTTIHLTNLSRTTPHFLH